jgi:glycosyltransferase involved in cell wall biosynthesis
MNERTTQLRGRLQRGADLLAGFVPWPSRGSRTGFYCNTRPGSGGPAGFVRKLDQELQRRGTKLVYRKLHGSEGALLAQPSRGDWFYHLCRRWGIRTVARVDGFYLPSYFDNRPQPPGFQDRRLTLDKMAINYRMQHDLAQADFVIYQSAFSKQMADQFLYCRRERFEVVHNGVDLARFCPGAHAGRRRLLSAGTLRDEYMLGTVLPVFERLWERHDLELMVVGRMDEISHRLLDEFMERFPSAVERVRVVGAVPNDEMARHMREADVLIHPRLGDWCPNTVIEALACGLPVVCGSWGGTAELVGDAGDIVPTGPWEYGETFVDGITAAVECMLDDLEQHKERARARAEACFDIRQVAARYLVALGYEGKV